MARGTWARVAFQAGAIVWSAHGRGEFEFDPLCLLSEPTNDDGRMPYNPEVLKAIQESGKLG